MKKRTILALMFIASSMLLASCNGEIRRDSNQHSADTTGSSNSTPNDSTKDETPETSIDSVYELLDSYIKANSYSLSQTFNSKEYLTKYTEKAIYDEWSKKGHIELPSFDTSKYPTSVLYDFTYENQEIKIGVPTHNLSNGSVTVFQYSSQLNYLNWLSSNDFNDSVLTLDEDENVISNDNLVLKTFATLIGKADLVSSGALDKATFKVEANKFDNLNQ